ncbi:MAG: hypothetical protein LBS52_04930 [Dysgonamonadaceae bacterium]|jgi:DNA mismatch repair ATPase MutS|nr:hypothetical protein [Dysgonamonadaceae bacterium]
MKFEIDEQSIRDLEIFSTYKNSKSVFSVFDFTFFKGGRDKLYSFLSKPLTDLEQIVQRRDSIAFFQGILPMDLKTIDKDAIGFTDFYLKQVRSSAEMPSFAIYLSKLWNEINPSREFFTIENGAKSAIAFLKSLYEYATALSEKLSGANPPQSLAEKHRKVMDIFATQEFKSLLRLKKPTVYAAFKYDYFFRKVYRSELKFLIELVYEYDAYIAAAKAAQEHGFCYPDFSSPGEKRLQVEELFHPFLENAVPSSVELGDGRNLLFVSGPNMAGKSTFLKALGIATYLAHTGLPVPAKKMNLNLLTGISATVNIADDLNSGYSHFYAEVVRIKKVVDKLQSNNNMLVIFDELFRGTNVKDAYDGTMAITSAFAKIKTSFFVISSHIVEVAKNFEDKGSIRLGYFEVLQKNATPQYTYLLKEGVSDVRLGMYIIRKERLIENIESIIETTNKHKIQTK